MRKFINRGFTLIELLVVIAIIGILASIILINLNGARGKSRDAQRVANLQQISQIMAGDSTNSDTSNPLTACTGGTAPFATQKTTVCTGPGNAAQLASIVDPLGSTQAACQGSANTASAGTCQYAIYTTTGTAAPLFNNWEVVTYLESGSDAVGGPSAAGTVACVSSANSSIQFGAACK